MPRRDDGLLGMVLEAYFNMAESHPPAGFATGLVAAAIGAGYTWLWPKTFSGFGFLIGWLMFAISATMLVGAARGAIIGFFRRGRLRQQQRLEDLHDLTWQQFEEVVADMYRGKGFRVQEVGGKNDGGIDLLLHGPNGAVIPVQCKRWRDWRVGAPKVREFVGAMADFPGCSQGIYVTCGTYTLDAIKLAKRHNIELVDGEKLMRMISSVNGKALGWSAA